jgi:thymidylate synthase
MNAIMSLDLHGIYSVDGELAFSAKTDMNHFRKMTHGGHLIMGRKTYESLPAPLPGRTHWVITTNDKERDTHDVRFVNDWDTVLVRLRENHISHDIVWVIGGKWVWEAAYERLLIKNTYITRWCDVADSQSTNISFDCDRWLSNTTQYVIATHPATTTAPAHVIIRYSHVPYPQSPHPHAQYHELAKNILSDSIPRPTRNATTQSSFGHTLTYDLREGFPLLTAKRVFWRGVLQEFLFFWRGDTDTTILSSQGVNIWKPNTSREFLDSVGLSYPEGMMGPMYGYQFRHYGAPYDGTTGKPSAAGHDQLVQLIHGLIHDPHSRRHLLTTYNPSQVAEGVLYPCHSLIIQFYVETDGTLSMQTYQRSCDLFLGVPFNIASSALMLLTIAGMVGRVPRKMRMVLGDVHVYDTHVAAVREMLARQERSLPEVTFDVAGCEVVDTDTDADIAKKLAAVVDSRYVLTGYDPAPAIKVAMVA